jgi:hypothetical protein
MRDGRRPLSPRAQERWSNDKHLRELGYLLGRLALRRDIKAAGLVEIHDGDCPWPQGDCACEPLKLEPR